MIRGKHCFTIHEPGAGLNDDNPGTWHLLCGVAWGKYLNSYKLPSRWWGVAVDRKGVTYSFGVVTGYPDSPLLPYFSRSHVSGNWRIFDVPQTVLNRPAIHCSTWEHITVRQYINDLIGQLWPKESASGFDSSQ